MKTENGEKNERERDKQTDRRGNIKWQSFLPLQEKGYHLFLYAASGSALPLRIMKIWKYLQVDKNKSLNPHAPFQLPRINIMYLITIQNDLHGYYLLFSQRFNKLCRKLHDIPNRMWHSVVKNVLNSSPITTMYKKRLISPPRAPVHWKVQTQRLAL